MQKILIIAPNWIGDFVISNSLLRSLKWLYPDCQIDVLANNIIADLANCMSEITTVHRSNFVHGKLSLWQRYRWSKTLGSLKYSHAYILPNSLKSALIPWFASIPIRIGYLGEWRYLMLNNICKPSYYTRLVDKLNALAGCAPASLLLPRLLPDIQMKCDVLHKFNLNTHKSIIAICPGAEYGIAKQWPAVHHAALIKRLTSLGLQIWLIGAPTDMKIVNDIMQLCLSHENIYNLCGKTSITEATSLLSYSAVVISNDSGLLHVASALDMPVVGIYGSTSSMVAPPLAINATIISTDIECSPCNQRTCRYQHYRCLYDITVTQVFDATTNLLNKCRHAKTNNILN
jgi:heptosyltransferase II